MNKLVVLTGAGVSAESGIPTFRDANGLWEGHDIMEVASIQGWHKNKKLVLDFYNKRRENAKAAKPNFAHLALAELEKQFDVTIITQNVDDLHEKAGSTKVIHLHGELFKSQSTANPDLIYEMQGWEINIGDTCELGSQLRPFIVWFGEAVPKMEEAIKIASAADIFLVIGTSMQVYPAASLIDFVPYTAPKYIIDKKVPYINSGVISIENTATEGIKEFLNYIQA
jgi:NAD-dependent deacetylase